MTHVADWFLIALVALIVGAGWWLLDWGVRALFRAVPRTDREQRRRRSQLDAAVMIPPQRR